MTVKRRRKQSLIPEDLLGMMYFLSSLLDRFSRMLPKPERIELLTYREAVRYFVESRPEGIEVVKGVLGLKRRARSIKTYWRFLDKENNVLKNAGGKPYGREFVVRELDEELQECFDGMDVLIFE